MLDNLNRRRERNAQLSRSFIRLTISFSIIFAAVVIFFGSIVVFDTATGLPRAVAQLESSIAEAKRQSSILIGSSTKSTAFKSRIRRHLKRLSDLSSPNGAEKIHKALVAALQKSLESGDYISLVNLVTGLDPEVQSVLSKIQNLKADAKHESYLIEVKSLALTLGELERNIELIPTAYGNVLLKAEQSLRLAEKKLSEPGFQASELWKRLGLGAIICSFLFVILRYFSGLHKQYHFEELRAADEELAVRKFVVAYRGASADDEARRDILKSLVQKGPQLSSTKEESGLSKEQVGIVSDLIGAFTKRF